MDRKHRNGIMINRSIGGADTKRFVAILALLMIVASFASAESDGPERRLAKKPVKLIEDTIDKSAGDVPCFRIETPVATYYLEKIGMGLSSMVDKEGFDWISFHNRPGSGAGGEYRGFPNAVHKQDGSFFHPKNRGTDPSTAHVVYHDCQRIEPDSGRRRRIAPGLL